MHVLQASLRIPLPFHPSLVRGNIHVQKGFHARVPGPGKGGREEAPVQQGLLQLEAEDDVQGICDLCVEEGGAEGRKKGREGGKEGRVNGRAD